MCFGWKVRRRHSVIGSKNSQSLEKALGSALCWTEVAVSLGPAAEQQPSWKFQREPPEEREPQRAWKSIASWYPQRRDRDALTKLQGRPEHSPDVKCGPRNPHRGGGLAGSTCLHTPLTTSG